MSASGISKLPRPITDPDEDIPVGSVALDEWGDAWQRISNDHLWWVVERSWAGMTLAEVLKTCDTLTLIYEPSAE